jgi:hypothetical protein
MSACSFVYSAVDRNGAQDYIRRSAALAKRGVEGEGAIDAAIAGDATAQGMEAALNVKSES